VRQPMRGQEASGLDRKLSTFAFIEEGDIATLIVGTRATRYRENSEYMPLEICIANNGLRQLVLTRESFVLIDEEGNRYPAANPKELMEGYDFLDLDRNSLAELEDIVFNKFAAYTRYGSKFSPTHQAVALRSNLVRDLVSLPKFGYMVDFIYFPTPATGLKGHRFELFVESSELQDPIFVRFLVE
jgi:hypothetical protein